MAVLNINELANILKPVVLPGESLNLFIAKEGKEHNQGVAYLDDGTMVVIENARKMIGKTVDLTVTSVLQTTAGRMIFAKIREDGPKTYNKVIALVPAAGIGKRFGTDKNKPFFILAGKPIIIWSLELLQSIDEIDEIIPVVKEDDIMTAAELIDEYGIRKVKQIMPGGKERQDFGL